MRPEFDRDELRVYQRAIAFVAWCSRLRHSGHIPRSTTTTPDKASTGVVLNIAEGKSYLADIVRMLVAWERHLEER